MRRGSGNTYLPTYASCVCVYCEPTAWPGLAWLGWLGRVCRYYTVLTVLTVLTTGGVLGVTAFRFAQLAGWMQAPSRRSIAIPRHRSLI